MPVLRLGPCFCGATLVALSATATAQGEPAPAAPAAVTAEGDAFIVLVGAAGRDPELEALLRELLERRRVRPHIFAQGAFGREQLLHAAAPGNGVQVFVVPGLNGNVGLYFRAPDGERFLLRNVVLRAGFDDVGRELVGQVIETAVASLQHSKDGLTREEAQQALAGDTRGADPDPLATPAEPVKGSVPAPTKAPAATRGRGSTVVDGWLALRYGTLALGPRLGLGHGPGVELGLGLKRGLLWRGRATIERDFPQSFATSYIAAELARVRGRFALDVGLPLAAPHTVLVSVGIGQDWLSVTPAAAAGSGVSPAPAFSYQAPVAEAELRYEVAIMRFRLAASIGADVSLVETHYDVARGAERENVARPWRIRPSTSLALAFCPVWATF